VGRESLPVERTECITGTVLCGVALSSSRKQQQQQQQLSFSEKWLKLLLTHPGEDHPRNLFRSAVRSPESPLFIRLRCVL
jgi:hypothetical protein